MLESLAGHEYYCFLDGFLGYFQIPIALKDQEKTTFTYPYGTFAYKQMPFGLCNVPATFQRCMTAIFHELIEDSMEVFMDDFSVFGSSFEHYLKNLEKMLKRCEETNLVLNWEKCHFMILLHQEFDIEIRNKKGAENLTADHLSRLENPDLGKLTKAEIRDLFLEERLIVVSDKNNEPCVLTESYEGASPEMRQHKSFDNVIVARWSKFAMHVKELEISPREMKHLKTIDYMSKWVEAQAFPTNDARNIVNFLKRLFAQFGIPKALISDRGCSPGKLKARWYEPFSVSKDMRNDAIDLYDEDGNEFIVNKQPVKPYQKDVLDTNRDDNITL
ncbi:reverse transcriptase domain-containing protein [Tanacetum coccineum]